MATTTTDQVLRLSRAYNDAVRAYGGTITRKAADPSPETIAAEEKAHQAVRDTDYALHMAARALYEI